MILGIRYTDEHLDRIQELVDVYFPHLEQTWIDNIAFDNYSNDHHMLGFYWRTADFKEPQENESMPLSEFILIHLAPLVVPSMDVLFKFLLDPNETKHVVDLLFDYHKTMKSYANINGIS